MKNEQTTDGAGENDTEHIYHLADKKKDSHFSPKGQQKTRADIIVFSQSIYDF